MNSFLPEKAHYSIFTLHKCFSKALKNLNDQVCSELTQSFTGSLSESVLAAEAAVCVFQEEPDLVRLQRPIGRLSFPDLHRVNSADRCVTNPGSLCRTITMFSGSRSAADLYFLPARDL